MPGRTLGDVDSADRPGALGHLLEAGDHPQQRRLAAARRADEHDELAVEDREIDVVHGDEAAGEDLRDVLETDLSHAGLPAYSIVRESGIDHWAPVCID